MAGSSDSHDWSTFQKSSIIPGAGVMLVCGLSTEALIFFLSAFEPPHVEPDWSLVYPELAGMYHGDGDMGSMELIKDKKTPTEELIIASDAGVDQKLMESLDRDLKN